MRHIILLTMLALAVAVVALPAAAGPRLAPDAALAQAGAGVEADGRTLHVDEDDGDDEGDGSREAPFATISAAVAVVEPGDRVEIAAGTYEEKVTIDRSGTAEAPIVIAAASGAEVTIDEEVVGVSADHVTLEGFEVAGTGDGQAGGVFVTGGTGITLRNLTARDNEGAGLRVKPLDAPVIDLLVEGGEYSDNDGAGIAATGEEELRGLTIDGVTVHDNDGDGIQIERASDVEVRNSRTTKNGEGDERNGLFLKEVVGALVTDHWTEDNGHDGIALRLAESVVITRSVSRGNDHHGFDSIEFSRDISFIGNVAYGNGDDPEDKGLYVTATDTIWIFNNVFAHNSGDQLAFSDEGGPVTNVSSDHNLFWREDGERLVRWFDAYYAELWEYQEASGQDAASLDADPAMVDPDEGDMRLTDESPAVDAGRVVEGLSGDHCGSAPDIGAVESGCPASG